MTATATVAGVKAAPAESTPAPTPVPDAESREWVRSLAAAGAEREAAVARLHALLLRAARFEVARRRPTLPHLRGDELDDIATEAADDALMSVLRRLGDYRGASRFTTWVFKFAILEAGVKLRKRAWQRREVPLEPATWGLFASAGLEPDAEAEQGELLGTLQAAIAEILTPHQRRVLVALALNGVPIDVLADRRGTTRGALYKTLHDARRKLRAHLDERGLSLGWHGGSVMERPDLKQALGRLLGPADPEVSCEVCFEELDRYVDLEVAGADADAAIPGLRAHLAGCPACREEHESLYALVSGEQAL